MSERPHEDALRARWTLEGRIPLSGLAEGASWHRARSLRTDEIVTLFLVQGSQALEVADAARRAYLVQDPHLLPVRDIEVFDGSRSPDEQSTDSPAGAGSDVPAADEVLTAVEYPLPPAPPLAAMLTDGLVRPETARSIIGEAATGLEVARRRGLRHQFLDSNRVFVDTAQSWVTILGVGVEAASHPDAARSGDVASFEDVGTLVALLYRAITGTSRAIGGGSPVARPSTVLSRRVPEDLDLLCDMVLNGAAEDSPASTRELIAELAPWQSIPVTLEAYDPAEGAAAAAPTPSAPPAPSDAPVSVEATDEASGERPEARQEAPPEAAAEESSDEDSAGSPTAASDAEPPAAGPPEDPPATAPGVGPVAGAAGAAGVAGAGATTSTPSPEPPSRAAAPTAASEPGPAPGTSAAPETPAPETPTPEAASEPEPGPTHAASPATQDQAPAAPTAPAPTDDKAPTAADTPTAGAAPASSDSPVPSAPSVPSAQPDEPTSSASPMAEHSVPSPSSSASPDTSSADEAPAGAVPADPASAHAGPSDEAPTSGSPDAAQSEEESAQALVEDLDLNESRSKSAFPGHLGIDKPAEPWSRPATSSRPSAWITSPRTPAGSTDAASAEQKETGSSEPTAGGEPEAPTASPSAEHPPTDGASADDAAAHALETPIEDSSAGESESAPAASTIAVAGAATTAGAAAAASASSPASESAESQPAAPESAGPAPAEHDPAGSGTAASAPTPAPEGSPAPAPSPAAPSPSAPSAPSPPAAASSATSAPSPAAAATSGASAPSPAAESGAAAGTRASGVEHDPEPEDAVGPIIIRGRDRSPVDTDRPTEVTSASRPSLMRDVAAVALDDETPQNTYASSPQPREERSRQSQWVLVLGILAVIVALVLAITTITSTLRRDDAAPEESASPPAATSEAEEEPEEEPSEDEEPTEEEELPAPALTDVEAFAEGGNQNVDYPENAGRLTDGDGESVWSSKIYQSAEYGGLKEGIGFTIPFEEESTIEKIVVTTADVSGGTIELYTLADDGSRGDKLADGDFADGGKLELKPEEATDADGIVLYIAELPSDPDGGFRAKIAEVAAE